MRKILDNDALPSYKDAISQDHWKLIAPYISSSDLCSASLACTRWHEIFAPQLWGHPASHFGTQDDSVYVALTRFRRTLRWARLYVRQMTHTLHLPPAHSEIYEGPHAEWLRDMLERLPRLQCLIVDALPFFDHACLMELRRPLTINTGPSAYHFAQSLRLLNAAQCSNATYSGLAAALKQFPGLLYLDLSETSASRHTQVLQALECMQDLQVLKLKHVGLKDSEAAVLARAIGTRVRSLDVSANHLTDTSARSLLEYCFRRRSDRRSGNRHTATPLEPGSDTIGQYYGEALELHLRDRLTSDFADRLVIQDDVNPGLTHLYTSDNFFTVEAISSFLQTGSLQYLDAGSMAKSLIVESNPSSPLAMALSVNHIPGTQKLIAAIKHTNCDNLTYLRISHEFVTQEAIMHTNAAEQPAELLGTMPTIKPTEAQELDSQIVSELATAETVHELGSEPIFELEGETCCGEHPPQADTKELFSSEDDPPLMKIRRGSTFAPESTLTMGEIEYNGFLRPGGDRPRSYSGIVEERQARAAHHRAHSNYFTPSLLPRLHTLALCDVPQITIDNNVAESIIRLVEDCALESDFAKQEARHSYVHPPGTSQKAFESQYLSSIFSLQRIILELKPDRENTKTKASWRVQPTSNATTEDVDSEAFWDAAQQDFTFFDDEECGQPMEQANPVPSWFMDPIPSMVKSATGPANSGKTTVEPNQDAQIDVISKITKFRQECKAAKQARLAVGSSDEYVVGYWQGQIQVVHPDHRRNADEARDCYGNIFEKGYRYR